MTIVLLRISLHRVKRVEHLIRSLSCCPLIPIVKMEDAPTLLKIPKSECKIQSFVLSELCTVILWQDCYGKGNLRRSFCSTDGRRFPNCECLFVHRETWLFLSVYMDDFKFQIGSMFCFFLKYPIKKLMLENQHLSLIMCTWDTLKNNVL